MTVPRSPLTMDDVARMIREANEEDVRRAKERDEFEERFIALKLARKSTSEIAQTLSLTVKQAERLTTRLRADGRLPNEWLTSRQAEDLTGRQFGRLTVLNREGRYKRGGGSEPMWSCRCSCREGQVTVVAHYNLLYGYTKSCGCLRAEIIPKTDAERYVVRLAMYARRREHGLCPLCGLRAPKEGSNVCTECRAPRNRSLAARYERQRAAGLCVSCKEPQVAANYCWRHWLGRTSIEACGNPTLTETIDAIWHKQEGRCTYSGVVLMPGRNASLDHIVPRSRGGMNVENNLQWIALGLNKGKGDLTHDEFIGVCRAVVEHRQGVSHDDPPARPSCVRLEHWFKRYARGTKEDWRAFEKRYEAQNGRCFYTGIRLTPGFNASLDHATPGLASLENYNFVLIAVNRMKQRMTDVQFVEFCTRVVERFAPTKAQRETGRRYVEATPTNLRRSERRNESRR